MTLVELLIGFALIVLAENEYEIRVRALNTRKRRTLIAVLSVCWAVGLLARYPR